MMHQAGGIVQRMGRSSGSLLKGISCLFCEAWFVLHVLTAFGSMGLIV